MGRETTGISGPATPLRTHVVATLVDLVDHEPDPDMHRAATFVLAMIARDVAPEPQLVADLEPHVYDVPFAYASTLDQTQVCATIHGLLRPDARSLERAITYVLQDKLCPTLRDAAVDVFAANIAALYRTTSIDLKILTPAQHAKLRTAAHAFRARATDPQSADRYLAELLH